MIQEPVQPTAASTPPSRPSGSGRSNRGLIALVIVGCIALAAPVVAAFAVSSTPVRSTAVGASADPASSAAPNSEEDGDNEKIKGNGKGNNGNGNGNGGNKGDKGFKLNGNSGKGGITIRALAGNQISLQTVDGWSRTITVTSTTVITKGGQTITVADLNVGDPIRFHQVRNADGTYTIDAIAVPVPKTAGEVSAVDATTITIKRGNTTRVITVNGSTVYTLGDAAGTKADVKVGSEIDAQGTLSGETFTATAIEIELPHLGGEVTAKTADTITVKKGDGTTATIHVSGSTKYKVKGKDAATLADVAVGGRVSAEGTLRADGSLDAVSVNGKAPKGPKVPDDDDDKAPASATPG